MLNKCQINYKVNQRIGVIKSIKRSGRVRKLERREKGGRENLKEYRNNEFPDLIVILKTMLRMALTRENDVNVAYYILRATAMKNSNGAP